MINKLREIAKNNISKDKKYELIYNILKDENCFKKMNIKTAYSILYDLGFKETEIKKIYNEIIFKKL